MTNNADRTERTARLARVYDRAQVRFQRRLIARDAHLRQMEAAWARLSAPQGGHLDLTDEAWRLCARLIRATERNAGLVQPAH